MNGYGSTIIQSSEGTGNEGREVVAVTGAARGIGRGIAEEFAHAGHDIIVFDLLEAQSDAEQTVDIVRATGQQSVFIELDVRKPEAIPDALDRGIRELNLPRILINNAGTVRRGPALDVTPEDWDIVVDTCLRGAFFCAQAFARRIVAARASAVIVNIASIFGLVGGPNRAAYSAAKAGLVNLTRVLAYEWYPHGIRVNCVAPTFVSTPMTSQLLATGLDITNKSFGQKVASVEDVARAVRFLAGGDAGMINGYALAIDGGWVSW